VCGCVCGCVVVVGNDHIALRLFLWATESPDYGTPAHREGRAVWFAACADTRVLPWLNIAAAHLSARLPDSRRAC
jgi:hypothetical protein